MNATQIMGIRRRLCDTAARALDYTQVSTDQAINVGQCERSTVTDFPGWSVPLARRGIALRAARHRDSTTDAAVRITMAELVRTGEPERTFQRLQDFVASVDVFTRRALFNGAVNWLDGWRSMTPTDVEFIDGDRFTFEASRNMHLTARIDGISADGTHAFVVVAGVPDMARCRLLAGNAALLGHLTNHPVDAVRLVYPSSARTVTIPVTVDLLDDAADRYVHAMNAVLEDATEVSPGPWCRFCDRRFDCPATTDASAAS